MAATHKMVNGRLVELSPAEAAAVQAEWDANPPLTPAQARAKLREQVNAALDAAEDRAAMQLRGLVLVLVDELNAHATKINAILTAIDNAGTLAQLKTAAAAIADYPQRTASQVRNAVKTKITAGDADS